jgi:DNA helicase-2/ATP-dependent DNA helicase PcrA
VTIDYQKELNAEQYRIVREGDGAVLVLAGAGSGKTRTITYRVAYLLEQGVLPQEILLLTFTNKAAAQMLSRVAFLLKHEPAGLWGGTFHSVASRLLRLYATQIGHTSNFTIFDQEDTHTLMKMCLKELSVDTTSRRFSSPAKLCSLVSYARNANKPLREVIQQRYPSAMDASAIIERLAEAYEIHKREADAMDFDDLLLQLRRLLSEQPAIRARLSEQFRYILVDEYQDTNVVQADLIRLLSERHKNVLVVGDDAQSIYSFRAAEIKNILCFSQMYPNTKTFRLTTNYRSTPQILDVANQSILNNVDQFEKKLVAVVQPREKPLLVPTANSAQEAQYIATQILQLREQHISLREIAVLFRAAFHSQALEFELLKRDIPYEYRGGLKFFERAHIKDVIAHLRIKLNPKDEAAWLRVLGLQSGVGLSTAQNVWSQVRHTNDLAQALAIDLSVSKRALSGWNALAGTLRKLLSQDHPADLIRLVLAGDYRDYLEAEYPDFMDRLEDLEQFALFAEQTADLQKFLNDLSLTDEYGACRGQETQEERLALSTIHQAKGLEWDTVFVMHLADGKFPNPRALEEDSGLEEERRLFYVATTRARKRLFFTYPLTSGYDTLLLHQPSLFLQELPAKLFEHVRVRRPIISSSSDEESIVVFDELGEIVAKPSVAKKSFLRNVNELI